MIRTIEVVQDPDDPTALALDFPDDLLIEAGWKVGDSLEFTDTGNNTWSLQKTED
jgi:hypothetical protein|tara:strand:+ start:322 stop:486 length:165 start_codon:yes stop_codon:yes gene_type:complete